MNASLIAEVKARAKAVQPLAECVQGRQNYNANS
jgi:hypothetical protein